MGALMKNLSALRLWICLAFVSVCCAGYSQDVLSLTNKSGNTIEAQVLSLQGSVVNLRMAGGRNYQYPLLNLDKASQDMVLAEIENQRIARVAKTTYGPRSTRATRLAAIQSAGGAVESEAAVIEALDWLQAQQNQNTGAIGTSYPVAMSGLSLLAFLGHGEGLDSPKYGETVSALADYLSERARKNRGMMTSGEEGFHECYEHGIGTIALAELIGMTRQLKQRGDLAEYEVAFKKAIKIILDGQTDTGSWRYGFLTRGGSDDMSLMGWQVQALSLAKESGTDFSGLDRALQKAAKCSAAMQDPEGAFVYRPDSAEGKFSLTGIGIANLTAGGEKASPAYAKGMAYLEKNSKTLPSSYYSAYYHSMVFLQAGGSGWQSYQSGPMKTLLARQMADGSFPGYNGFGKDDSVIMQTALGALMLEVYYRYPVQ